MKKPRPFLNLKSTSTGIWKDARSQPVLYIDGEPIANTWEELVGWLDFICQVPKFKITPIQLSFTTQNSFPSLSCEMTLLYDDSRVLPDANTLALPSTDTCHAWCVTRGECEQMVSQPSFFGFTFRFVCSHIENELQIFREIMESHHIAVYVPITPQYEPPATAPRY